MDIDSGQADAEYLCKDLTFLIIGALFEVHKELGNLHKENVCHKALELEF